MDRERFRAVDEVFALALEAPPERRAALIEQRCAGDDALRGEVEALLEAHGAAGAFLNEPAATRGLEALATARGAEDNAVGRRFGAWEATERIGAGGMGAVYRARRWDQQFDKEVAVKVIHWWMDTGEVLRRFERERRLLAQLQHPNIAMLMDAGVTEDGAPYIVMEHVDGRPIDEHCRDGNLPVDRRLALFLDACAAVQAAHNGLVVHLDLKPGNILVSRDGRVKLVDFGIAQLLDAGGDEAKALTRAAQRVFTPAYAAPEQIDGGPLTTATDVYALGVVLYQLLAGVRPFRETPDSTRSIEDAIRTQTPSLPSEAATTGVPTDARAARRLSRRLEGDLDNIVLMAMRKEPERRYPSVAALAQDVSRHLEGRTVTARPDTLGYRASRFVRRNRVAVAAAALVFLALVGGLAGVAWQAGAAAEQRDRAEQRFADLRRLTNSMIANVDQRLADLPGATEARRAIVTEATAYLDSLAGEAGDDPDLLLELAASYVQLGRLQRNVIASDLGDTASALESHLKALDLRRRAADLRPGDAAARIGLAESHLRVGDMRRAQGDLDGAVEHYRRSETLFAGVGEAGGSDRLDQMHHRAVVLTKIGIVESMRGDLEAAEAAYSASLETNAAIVEADPSRLVSLRNTAVSHEKLGDIAESRGDAQAALDRYTEARAIYERLADAEPNDTRHLFALAVAHSKQGEVLGHPAYTNLGDLDGALREYRAGRELIDRLLRADPADARARMAAAFFDRRLGTLLSLGGHHEAALEHQMSAHAAAAALAEANPTDVRSLGDVASSRLTIADTYDAMERPDDALRWRLRAIEAHRDLLEVNPDLAVARTEMAVALRQAGRHAMDLAEGESSERAGRDRLAQAQAWLAESVAIFEALERDGALRAASRETYQDAIEDLANCRRIAEAGDLGA